MLSKLIAFAVLSLVLLQLHQVNSDDSVNGCQKNFSKVGDKCLLAFNQWNNWYMADRQCRSLGAGLLSVQNQNQLQQISKWLSVTIPYSSNLWTSGNKLGEKNVYYWQSAGQRATYLPWSAYEPKPATGDCVMLIASNYNSGSYSDFGLAVKHCTYSSNYVCEQNLQSNYSNNTTSRICLKPGSYETAQVLV